MTLTPLNIESHIVSRPPTPEQPKDVSSWYKWEYMTLNFGEYVGRPAANIEAHKSFLTYFFAEGWRVDAVLRSDESGDWTSVSESESNNTGTTSTQTQGTSSTEGSSSAQSSSTSSGSSTLSGLYVSGSSSASSSGNNSSVGEASSNGQTTTNAEASVHSEASGGPYWYAYSRIRLKRRRLDSESVLADMIESFTNAYNEGREINNERYDELVSLYALMLTHTESEANAVPISGISPSDFTNLANDVAAKFEAKIRTKPAALDDIIAVARANINNATIAFRNQVYTIPANWLQSRENEINRQFNAKIAAAKATMIANGTFNGTTWPNVESGYERDRQYALTDLADSMVKLRIDAFGESAKVTADSEARLAEAAAKLSEVQASMAAGEAKIAEVRREIMEAALRVSEAVQKQRVGLTELRNTVVKWMLDFMERREDDYPGLDQLVTVADKLGYGESISGSSTPTS